VAEKTTVGALPPRMIPAATGLIIIQPVEVGILGNFIHLSYVYAPPTDTMFFSSVLSGTL